MDKPVSVIIAAYNIEEYISDCINSCINQTFQKIEIVIVNDGSTDKTGEICKKYSENDNRIVLINKKNEGLVCARQTGILNASNDFIFFLDGDDVIPINAIEKLINAANDDIDIVLGGQKVLMNNGLTKLRSLDFVGNNRIDLINCIFNKANPNIVGHLYAKSLFASVKFYNSLDKSIGEDLVTIIQLAYYANKIVQIPEITYYYFRRDSSITQKSGKNVFAEGFNAFVIVTKFLDEKKLLMPLKVSYFKLLKTFVVGYLSSNISINLYKNQLKESVRFAILNWSDFKKTSTLNEKIIFLIAFLNLKLSRFLIFQYNKFR